MLKKLGYPMQETPATPTVILPKVLGCLTKRLETMGTFFTELEAEVKAASEGKDRKEREMGKAAILQKTFGCKLL